VGLQAGVATPELFSALVLVAMVTTIMTPPWLSFLDRREPGKPSHVEESVEPSRTLTASVPDDEGEPG
jgi:hypothetical protein